MDLTKLKFDFNAIADIEEKAGAGIGSLFSNDKMGFNTLRLLIWGGMKWQDKTLTLGGAGIGIQNYIQGGGTVDEMGEKITDAIQASGLFGNFTKAGE